MSQVSAESRITQQVVVSVAERLHGIAVEHVREMLELPPLTALPRVPEYVRGVMNLRDRVIPVLDLRMKLGLPSLGSEVEEMCTMLQQREQDHRNWLTELENSVNEAREFKLQTNPHKCAFGLWFDQFEHPNRQIRSFVQRFDEPHKAIHAIAGEVTALVDNGQVDEAKAIIENTKDTQLAEMIQLFARLQALLRESLQEVAVVLDSGTQPFAVSVDDVIAVEWLQVMDNHDLEAEFANTGTEAHAVALRKGEKQEIVTLLQPLHLLTDVDATAIERASGVEA